MRPSRGSCAISALTAEEIQNLSLNASLAVMSACQTGLGNVHDAGIIGLARAFQLAGVTRVLMTLWNVDDQVTAEFMAMFAAEVRTGTPNRTLQRVMIRMRSKYTDPKLWAPFVLFGRID